MLRTLHWCYSAALHYCYSAVPSGSRRLRRRRFGFVRTAASLPVERNAISDRAALDLTESCFTTSAALRHCRACNDYDAIGSFGISATIAAQEQTATSCGCVDSTPSQPCQLCQHCLTTNGTASLTERIGGVRNELAHKDLLVGVPAAQRSVSRPTGAPLLSQQYRCARVVLCGGMLWIDGCARCGIVAGSSKGRLLVRAIRALC